MNNENPKNYEVISTDEPIINSNQDKLPVLWEETEVPFPFELNAIQKKSFIKKMEDYFRENNIPYNRKQFSKTEKQTLLQGRDTLINALYLGGFDPKKPSYSFAKSLEIGLSQRKSTIRQVQDFVNNLNPNKYLEHEDFIGPLAIKQTDREQILQKNLYLTPDLSQEISLLEFARERNKTIENTYTDIIKCLRNNDQFRPSKQLNENEKASFVRTCMMSFMNSGMIEIAVDASFLLNKIERFSPKDFLDYVLQSNNKTIAQPEYNNILNYLNDLHQQINIVVDQTKSRLADTLQTKNANDFASLNGTVLSRYFNLFIPTMISEPAIKDSLESIYGDMWQEGRSTDINGVLIPTIQTLKNAKKILLNSLPTGQSIHDPEVNRMNDAISAWEEYERSLRHTETEKKDIPERIAQLDSKIRNINYADRFIISYQQKADIEEKWVVDQNISKQEQEEEFNEFIDIYGKIVDIKNLLTNFERYRSIIEEKKDVAKFINTGEIPPISFMESRFKARIVREKSVIDTESKMVEIASEKDVQTHRINLELAQARKTEFEKILEQLTRIGGSHEVRKSIFKQYFLGESIDWSVRINTIEKAKQEIVQIREMPEQENYGQIIKQPSGEFTLAKSARIMSSVLAAKKSRNGKIYAALSEKMNNVDSASQTIDGYIASNQAELKAAINRKSKMTFKTAQTEVDSVDQRIQNCQSNAESYLALKETIESQPKLEFVKGKNFSVGEYCRQKSWIMHYLVHYMNKPYYDQKLTQLNEEIKNKFILPQLLKRIRILESYYQEISSPYYEKRTVDKLTKKMVELNLVANK